MKNIINTLETREIGWYLITVDQDSEVIPMHWNSKNWCENRKGEKLVAKDFPFYKDFEVKAYPLYEDSEIDFIISDKLPYIEYLAELE